MRVPRPAQRLRQHQPAGQKLHQLPTQSQIMRAAAAEYGELGLLRQMFQRAGDAMRGEGGERRDGIFERQGGHGGA